MGSRDASPKPVVLEPDGRQPASDGRAFEDLLSSDPELLRSLIDQAADAVCLHEIGGRILDVNRRMCETLGFTREELLQLSILDVDVTATREETAAAASRLVPGEPQRAERVLRRKDGSTIPIELSLSLIVSGKKQLLLGLARDITDRKRAEHAQEEAQRDLEAKVRERTQHLEVVNRQLEAEARTRERFEAALRESEERFRELAERGRLLAWEADARTWRFVYVGPQAADLLGYPVGTGTARTFGWITYTRPTATGLSSTAECKARTRRTTSSSIG
jgi:PAS domain S-box-containing protein